MSHKSLPYFSRIRRWCLAQEKVTEVFQWESVVFKVGARVFAICSMEPPLAITLKPRRDNLDAYLYHPAIDIARYVGRFGWITITIEDRDTAGLALSLVQESYQVVSAGKRKKRKR